MTTRMKEQSAAALAGNNGFSLISNGKLLHLYISMLKYRMIEERARLLFEERRLNGNSDAAVIPEVSQAVGQESCHVAAVVGVAIDLLPEDTIAPLHGDLIAGFGFIQGKGEPLDKLFGSLFARAARPKIAAQIKIATGASLANKRKKNGKIAVAFHGDGAAALGCWQEAMNVASAKQLPILFVCQSSLGVEEFAHNAEACGFPIITVDGNDVVAVYRVATEAITHARNGNGPTLIECKTGPCQDDDPILNMESYLARKGLFSVELKLKVAAGIRKELDAAMEASGDWRIH